MKNALIGYSGFVGTTLGTQAKFDDKFRSTTIPEIKGRNYSKVVCCGAPAQKWIANRDPDADLANLNVLMDCLSSVRAGLFILISTVDVFSQPQNVYEDTPVSALGLQPYGLHRRLLEQFVETNFDTHLIVRLPGLVGTGLRKNAIYDLVNNNAINQIDSRNVFQFYPMSSLWKDIVTAVEAELRIVHFAAEPIAVSELSELALGIKFNNILDKPISAYDMRTRYANVFGKVGNYIYSKEETLDAIRKYAERPD